HVPPEVRRREWAEGTIWELLVAAQALPYRFASPFADLGMTARERRQLRREEELLKTTRVAYILPRPGTARWLPQPWLYVRTRRTGHYRVNHAGAIERYGKRTQRLGSGSITEHRWYPCTLRGVRWFQVVADGLMVRKGGQERTPQVGPTVAAEALPTETATCAGKAEGVAQLRLFP
ncbi:MAG: hypothetical protein HGA45_35790, partial [Chloroflexales bacterium]|nr:hypothetical protein [Chloroflexales bacterium]